MFYVSEVITEKPNEFKTKLQEAVYKKLEDLAIEYQRVETDEAITMTDCILINDKLNMQMVKTLFLCNRQKTTFYLFITTGSKTFKSKDFSKVLKISRVSFAPEELFEEILQTKIGTATVYSALIDDKKQIQIVIDKEVVSEEYYGCSYGTTSGYMKVKTADILQKFLPATNHQPIIIEV